MYFGHLALRRRWRDRDGQRRRLLPDPRAPARLAGDRLARPRRRGHRPGPVPALDGAAGHGVGRRAGHRPAGQRTAGRRRAVVVRRGSGHRGPESAIAPAGYTTVDSSTAPGTASEKVSTTADGAYVVKVSGTKGSVRPYNLRYTVVAPTAEQRCPAAAPAGYAAPGTLGSPAADLPTGVDALFLVDRTRLESAYAADGPATYTKLVQFAEGDGTVSAAPGVDGAVVELASSPAT